jgi:hypothetical protein
MSAEGHHRLDGPFPVLVIAILPSDRPAPRNTRYQADATPYLGRTSTGWIAPACGRRTHSITSSARCCSLHRQRFSGCLENRPSTDQIDIANLHVDESSPHFHVDIHSLGIGTARPNKFEMFPSIADGRPSRQVRSDVGSLIPIGILAWREPDPCRTVKRGSCRVRALQ